MIALLHNAGRLAEHLRRAAEQRSRQPEGAPGWAKKILQSEGLRRSLAGLISNSVKENKFSFRLPDSRLITKKIWAEGCPEFISFAEYQDLEDSDRSLFRVSFRLSLPDMLLHSIVGKTLTKVLEGVLSDGCHGYRPGRGQPTAVRAVRALCENRDAWVVKCDVAQFNETVDHAQLRLILEQIVKPKVDADCWRILSGTVEAMLAASAAVNGLPGQSILVGSGLAPALTNLYLSIIDKYLDDQKLRFVRYGDDLLVACASENEAKGVLTKLIEMIRSLKQQPSLKSALGVDACWGRGLCHRFDTDEEAVAFEFAHEKAEKLKSDVYSPMDSFDFIGFEFDGPRVLIRQETLAKAKARIQQYTQRSALIIERAIKRRDFTKGKVIKPPNYYEQSMDTFAVVSVNYVRDAIRRLNFFLGYKIKKSDAAHRRGRFEFCPGFGFACSILKCVDSEDVREQFALLDAYAFRRFRTLMGGMLRNRGPGLKRRYDFTNFDLRSEGLMTFKDVSNRYVPKGSPGGIAD